MHRAKRRKDDGMTKEEVTKVRVATRIERDPEIAADAIEILIDVGKNQKRQDITTVAEVP